MQSSIVFVFLYFVIAISGAIPDFHASARTPDNDVADKNRINESPFYGTTRNLNKERKKRIGIC